MKTITDDILNWSKNYIETPNESLGNVPVCPYAKEWQPDNEFIMVLIQNFDKLEKASDMMDKKGYYSSWPRDYYEGTVLKRQSYRRYRL